MMQKDKRDKNIQGEICYASLGEVNITFNHDEDDLLKFELTDFVDQV